MDRHQHHIYALSYVRERAVAGVAAALRHLSLFCTALDVFERHSTRESIHAYTIPFQTLYTCVRPWPSYENTAHLCASLSFVTSHSLHARDWSESAGGAELVTARALPNS